MRLEAEFKNPCQKCGGRMFAVPGGKPGMPLVRCERCGYQAYVVSAETAKLTLSKAVNK